MSLLDDIVAGALRSGIKAGARAVGSILDDVAEQTLSARAKVAATERLHDAPVVVVKEDVESKPIEVVAEVVCDANEER